MSRPNWSRARNDLLRGHQIPQTRHTGWIKFHCPDRHFGFVVDQSGEQHFFHNGDVVGDCQFEPGQPVTFEKGQSLGRPCAKSVRPSE